MNQIIEGLVASRGIESAFVDAWGNPATVTDETKIKLLKAMGYKVDDQSLLEHQVEDSVTQQWLSAVNPVQVFKHDEAVVFPLRVSIDTAASVHNVLLTLESGEEYKFEVEPVEQQLLNVAELEDEEVQEYAVTLDVELPLGYHQLSVSLNNVEIGHSRLIKVPERCFIPEPIENGKKIWGLSVQLYCVRSRKNWGIGDFSDLQVLVKNAAKQGADFIGLNPIHELYPANPDACSPYGPSSRRWLNYLYIDVEQVPEFDSKSVQVWVKEFGLEASGYGVC